MLRSLTLLGALGALAFAQEPIAPHSAIEPPAAAAAASLAASTKASPPDLLTTGEKSNWNLTAPYAECVEIAHRLEKASKQVKVLNIGTTPEGRTMIALVVSKDHAFTPEAAARTGKVIFLIQSGIHAGEIEGKDTVLMLVRDMTVTKTHAAWLDKAIFVIIPVFNVDGHESISPYNRPSQNGPRDTGTRNTAQHFNLNRDYMKADTPEMRAWLHIFTAWNPDFHIDNHVTDGSDMQYDVTWDMARNQDIAEPARTWVNQKFIPELDKRMAADGHLVAPYGSLQGQGNHREFFMEVFSPRYSHLYSAVQNRPSLLVETHSLKAARTRAWANYDIMKNAFDTILADPEALRKAVRDADAQMAALAGDRSAPPVYLAGTVSRTKSRPLLYHALKRQDVASIITGTTAPQYVAEKDDIETVIHDQIDTTIEAQMPLGYLIPPAWKDVADLLALHGVTMERTAKPITQEFETYRFGSLTTANGGDGIGRMMFSFDPPPRLVKEKITIPQGAYWVPMKQRRARLILAALEPEAPDSFVRYGYMYAAIASAGGRGGGGRRGAGGGGGRGGPPTANAGRGPGPAGGMPAEYLSEPIARKTMADNPDLAKEFLAQVESDPAFAADRTARLRWWYQHSKYEPSDNGRYPIVRVWEKNW
ncbi:MAG TPA: M14 family metallopeptidase [Bryobacteraceae bacterium]|nr:M14 family metallopeptidase [Bryobacteraceae bacterium]